MPPKENTKNPADIPVPKQFIAVRNKDNVTFVEGPFSKFSKGTRLESLKIEKPISGLSFNPSGNRCAVSTSNGILVYDCTPIKNGEDYEDPQFTLIQTINHNTAHYVELSPLGDYLVSFETYRKDLPLNHIIWDVNTGEAVLSFTQKLDLTVSSQPLIQWTDDEDYLMVLTLGSLAFYDGKNPTTPINTIKYNKMNAFQVAPKNKEGFSYVSLFVPVVQSQPAKILIYKVHEAAQNKTILPPPPPPSPADIACGKVKPNQPRLPKEVELTTTANLSFFKASEVKFLWHFQGTHLIIKTSVESDNNDSYYGETRLYLLTGDGNFNCNISFGPSKGPIHDVQWSPRHLEFVTLQGEAKNAKATVWSGKDCSPLKEFGSGPWNTIRFNNQGRFVALSGFGALSGKIEIWDKNKLIRLAQFQDNDSPRYLEWSPCGRQFLTATIFPWLRVDNMYKVYSYDGTLLYKETPNTVVPSNEPFFHQVSYRPSSLGVYPDYPADIQVVERAQRLMATPASSQRQVTGYVPPHLRAQGAKAPSKSDAMNSSQSTGPRDLQKERKKGVDVGNLGGASHVDKVINQASKKTTNTKSSTPVPPVQKWR